MNDKYNVLIVDDEYLVRELLHKTIDWDKLGCEIIGKASCADEVYEYLNDSYNDENSIDIIITDINMPVTDGISLSQVIKKQYPKIKILILTGYNDFEYAKSSIRIGIDDYILKPINEEEIEQALLRVIDKIKREQIKEFEYESYKQKLQENMPYLKEKFYLEMLYNKLGLQEIIERSDYFGIKINSSFIQIGLIQLVLPANKPYSEEERLIILFGLRNIIEQYFENFQDVVVLLDNQERIIVLLFNPDINLVEEMKYLLKIIKHNIDWEVAIGIGCVKKSIDKIWESYKEASQSLQYKTVIGNNQIIYYKDIGIVEENNDQYQSINDHEFKELQFFIKAGLREKCLEYVDKLFSKMTINQPINEESYIAYVRVQTTRLLSVLHYLISSMNINIEDVSIEKGYFDKIYTLRTIPEVKKYVIEFVEVIVDYIIKLKNNNVNDFLTEIDNYINENLYNQELTLKSIADHFYMNPSYLSRIYKQKKGISFKEFVIKKRLEKALELLRTTDLKIYEISERIGIADANYFSILFKKNMKMSISEYKKKFEK